MSKSQAAWFEGQIGKTFRESKPHWRPTVKGPQNAPNVIVILLDDVGFGDLGCYGSEIDTKNIDALADSGLRYRNFHVTAMCSPTRASLLTGRNSHSVGVGIIAEWSNGYPGYEGRISHQAATIPEVLSANGYACHAIGKWHLTNMEHYSAAGPHHDWPCGRGFDTWYGFHGALADHWNPELYEGNQPIHVEHDRDYHLTSDLVDHAIGRIRDHVTSAADRPFFTYLALGACHWPHHAPREYIEKYSGVYDKGWDKVREERFSRQKQLGIIPSDTDLAPRNPGVDAWDDVPSDVQGLAARLQETYAGFLDHTDDQIGRLISYLDQTGLRDDTLIVLLSDNGSSPEGGKTGALNLRKHMVYEQEEPEVGLANLNKLGSEFAYNHYPTGWAQVSNTPLKWYKKDAHGGGIRAPIIMNFPKSEDVTPGIREQYHHVSDIAATIYDIIGVEPLKTYKGVDQIPLHGTSMTYSFKASEANTTKSTQHYEILGDRAIWRNGLKAVSKHIKGDDFETDVWELYDVANDFSESHDLAKTYPEKLSEMIALWWKEAEEYGVLPLDDREWERAAERMRMNPSSTYTYFQDMARIDRLLAPDITKRSVSITAHFDKANKNDTGTILAWGSRFGGLSIHLSDGKIHGDYLYSESEPFPLSAELPEVKIQTIAFNIHHNDDPNATRASLILNGKKLAERILPKTWPTHGLTAGLTCGLDGGCPVDDGQKRQNKFTGRINKVTVAIGDGADQSEDVLRTLLAEE